MMIKRIILLWLLASTAQADLLDDELDPSPSASPEATSAPDSSIRPVDPDSPAKAVPRQVEPKKGAKSPKVKPTPTSDKKSRVLAPSTNKTARKEKEKKKPVLYQSNGLSGLRDKGTIELLDDVMVSQGTLKLEADQAKILFDEATDEVQTVTADGHIKMFRYDEDSGEQIKAFGDRVIFLNLERKIILEGNARLFRGVHLLRGDRLIYELDTGWIRAEKVEGEFHPEEGK